MFLTNFTLTVPQILRPAAKIANNRYDMTTVSEILRADPPYPSV